jgi:hypothetical protein
VTGAAGRAVADGATGTGAALAGALRRLRAEQRAAVLGAGDPDALDAAVLAHRRSAGRLLPAGGAGVPAWVFARWLGEAGDFDAAPRAALAATSRGGRARCRPLPQP